MTLGQLNFTTGTIAGISDYELVQELRAKRRLLEALEEMRRAIGDVNKTSALVEIEPSAFEDFLNDERPSADFWADKLFRARHSFN